MSEQTAEEYQRQLWHQPDRINRQQLQYYGDLRADEERAKVLAEWQATDIEEWVRQQCLEHGLGPRARWFCLVCRNEALARARAQGAATKVGISADAVITMIEAYRDDFAKVRDNAALIHDRCNGMMDYAIRSLADLQEWVRQQAALQKRQAATKDKERFDAKAKALEDDACPICGDSYYTNYTEKGGHLCNPDKVDLNKAEAWLGGHTVNCAVHQSRPCDCGR